MSVISRVAKFTIRAILAGLAKDAAKAERGVTNAVAKRDARISKLNKEIIELSKTEDAKIAKIREQAELEIRNIKAAKAKLVYLKGDHHHNCGIQCRDLNKKSQEALALKAKLEAVLK